MNLRRILIFGGLIFVVLSITTAKVILRNLSPAAALPVISTVTDFQLTNQFGALTTSAALRGKVCVADIIFTRCAGPCPRMTARMRELQNALLNRPNVLLVSLTTDPDFDSPKVLSDYAQRFGARDGRWLFLTGTKPQLRQFAVNDLKLSAVEVEPDKRESPEDLFVHSTLFVVIDQQGRVRKAVEGLAPGALEEITRAVRQLESE